MEVGHPESLTGGSCQRPTAMELKDMKARACVREVGSRSLSGTRQRVERKCPLMTYQKSLAPLIISNCGFSTNPMHEILSSDLMIIKDGVVVSNLVETTSGE